MHYQLHLHQLKLILDLSLDIKILKLYHQEVKLNIVKNIVDSHKGLIKVYNNKDSKGAIVDISLPAS